MTFYIILRITGTLEETLSDPLPYLQAKRLMIEMKKKRPGKYRLIKTSY